MLELDVVWEQAAKEAAMESSMEDGKRTDVMFELWRRVG